jgi:hypothetical protein
MKVGHERKVVWWNNVRVSLGFIAQTGAPIEQTYRALDQRDFQDFLSWAAGPGGAALDLENRRYGCDVVGRVRSAYESRPTTVSFAIEDIMLHWLAYARLASDLQRAAPNWIPFFFRGGIPLGLDVLGKRIFGAKERTTYPDMTWMPGLAHKVQDVGADPISLFVEELERRRASAQRGFRIWVLDTTFTGSTAFGNLQAAFKRVSPKGVPVDVTVAVILPVENNVQKNVRKQSDALTLGLHSRDGREVFVKRMKPVSVLRSLRVRIYPVARSLTEDVPEALEVSYGRPVGGKPTYVRGLCQDLIGRFTRGTDVVVTRRIGEKGKRTGDTAHDWLFNEFNPKHLRGILVDLGLSDDVAESCEDLLRLPTYAQYRGGPITVMPSRHACITDLSVCMSRLLRDLETG